MVTYQSESLGDLGGCQLTGCGGGLSLVDGMIPTLSADSGASMERFGLVDNARALCATFAERAAEVEGLRRLPDESIKELQDAGLFQALQPARFGGLEADPIEFFDAVLAVGGACGSTAWVLSVLAVHNWQLALFDLEAQEEVWGADNRVLIASSYVPSGSVERVDGGYELSGRWHFSSGCDHARWLFLGGVVPRDKDAPPPPDMRTFLLPESDYRIEDNWFVAGLAGSGSKDIVVEQAFVPEHRTHRFADLLAIDSPGNSVNTSPLFRVPFGGIFLNGVSTPALGVARGALAQFVESSRTRVMADNSPADVDAFTHLRIAEVTASLDGAYLQLAANMAEMVTLAERCDKPTLKRRARYRWDAARTTRIATEAVDAIFEASGGRAIFDSNPLQRAFRDVHAMRGHFNNNPEKAAQVYARAELGFPNKEFLL